MKEMDIDIETYSSINLSTAGKHKYIQAPDFEILLFAYCIDNGPIEICDFTNLESLPGHVLKALTDPKIIKRAHNAAFEKICIDKFFNLHSVNWECTMILAASLSYPLALDACAKALKLESRKDRKGNALIKLFCTPPKIYGPLEKWEDFKKYCIQDVAVEKEIHQQLKYFTIPAKEKKLYLIDQEINDTGVLIDDTLVKAAIKMDEDNRLILTSEAIALTGLPNPNSVAQLKKWIGTDDLTKKTVSDIINNYEGTKEAKEAKEVINVLKIRQELSKTSIKKYQAMLSCAGTDGRARGLTQFLGAPRTGRWSGRLIQLQNLVKNNLIDLDLARKLVRAGDARSVDLFFGSISNTLSQLVRTAFIPAKGNKLIITDFSAIEARVLSYFAGEKWRLDVFKADGKIYEASAVAMFHVPLESVTKDSAIRGKAKIAELALGYQGSVGALKKMGGEALGLSDHEMRQIVNRWRLANPKIVKLWYDTQNAALHTLYTGQKTIMKYFSFKLSRGDLFVQLPSGRLLHYAKPQIIDNTIYYEGQNQVTHQWDRLQTYGGKFIENIVQATARDMLAEKIILLHEKGYQIVFHVHDEIIIEAPENTDAKIITDIMSADIDWLPGLPNAADTTEGYYYRKD